MRRWGSFVFALSLCACGAHGSGEDAVQRDALSVDDTTPSLEDDALGPAHDATSPTDGGAASDSSTPPPPTDGSLPTDGGAPPPPPPPIDGGSPPPPPPPTDGGSPPPPSCGPYVGPASHCGTERWAVKVGEDFTAACAIALSSPSATTIPSLTSIPKPASLPPNSRLSGTESTEFVLHDVLLTAYKLEADSDYHLVLQDPSSGQTMIAEIPDPTCVPSSSNWFPLITAARKAMNTKFTVGSSFSTTATTVSVRGIGFFDQAHGQRGLAPNAIELHPVLGVCFGAGCTP